MHVDLGGYHVRDIEFVAAFDIDSEKVGKDLSEAIWSGQNNTIKFADVPKLGVKVERGMTHDGLGKYLKQKITKAPGETADIVGILKETQGRRARLLPAGRLRAGDQVVRRAGARRPASASSTACRSSSPARTTGTSASARPGLPIIGDDIKSPGRRDDRPPPARPPLPRPRRADERTSQLNVGGNMDFFNMLERERLDSKKISKTNAVTSIMGHELPEEDVHVGPSDYVAWLTDRKWAYIRLEGKAFGDVPLNVELKLEVWDSPNSAGVVIDAVRLRQARAQQRHRRPARRALQLPDEVAAYASARRRGARAHRGVHRRLRARALHPRRGEAVRRRGRPRPRPRQGARRRRALILLARVGRPPLDSPGHALPAGGREPGQRVR